MRQNTHSVDKLITDEAATHLRTDQFESTSQIISWFMVVVLQLVKDLLVVVGRFAANQSDTVVAEFSFEFELIE